MNRESPQAAVLLSELCTSHLEFEITQHNKFLHENMFLRFRTNLICNRDLIPQILTLSWIININMYYVLYLHMLVFKQSTVP